MSHPDLPDNRPVPVTRLAYDDVWQPRGWLLVDTPPEHSELAAPASSGADTDGSDIELAADAGEPDTDSDAGPAKPTGKGRKSS
jgi:hypothetical protein